MLTEHSRDAGSNFAPAQGMRRAAGEALSDTSVQIDPEKWFTDRPDELWRENEQVWKSQYLLWQLIFLFMEGKQVLKKSRYGSGWRAAPMMERTDSPVYAMNLVGFYSHNIKAKWTQSHTDIRFIAARDTDEASGAAKAASTIYDHYARKLYGELFRQTEAMLAQCGKYVRYYYYSDDADGGYARKEVYGTEQVKPGPDSYFCPDCGAAGELDTAGMQPKPPDRQYTTQTQVAGELDTAGMQSMAGPEGVESDEMAEGAGIGEIPEGPSATICPECGSPNAVIESVEPVEVQTLEGYEEEKQGDICCEVVPCFELKHDLACSPQDSAYLIRKRRVRVSDLESKFPGLKIRPAVSDSAALKAQQNLRESTYVTGPAGSSGRDSETAGEFVDFTQIWLKPQMYSRNVLKYGYTTALGMEMPAGTSLAEMFPKGLYIAKVEGVEGVVEVRDECHSDYWVGQVYMPKAMSALGTGIEDMIEGNRQYNLIMSLIYTQLRTSASPGVLYEESLLPNGVSSYLGNPLKNIPVRTMGLPEQRSLRDAVFQMQSNPPSPALFNYAQQLNNYEQLASRITDFSGGLPGVNNETATGAQIASANAQSLMAPQLALKAEMDRLGADVILKLFKEHCFDERYLSISGQRGKQNGVWLAAADLGTDIMTEVVPESFLPQTSFERRERLKGFLMDVGGPLGVKQMQAEMPEFLEQLTETYDVDLGGEDYSVAAEVSKQRIDQMTQALPMLQVMMQGMPPTTMDIDPMTGAMVEVPVDPMAEAGQFLLGILEPPIIPEEMGHIPAIDYLRDYLLTDAGKEMSPELRAGVVAMIHAHIEGAMAEAAITGQMQMAAQPMPMMSPDGEMPPDEGPKNKNPQKKQAEPGATKAKRPNPRPKPVETSVGA
jgi:hypothetical protein